MIASAAERSDSHHTPFIITRPQGMKDILEAPLIPDESAWTGSLCPVSSLDDYLLHLLDHLVDPHRNLFLFVLIALAIRPVRFRTPSSALLLHVVLALETPCVPFVDQPLPVRDKLSADVRRLRLVVLLELTAVVLQSAANLALLLLGQERARSRTPQKLLEAIDNLLLKLLAAEAPDSEPVLKLSYKSTG